jgi:hypothetical protein
MLTGVLRQARRKAAVTAFLEAGWAIAPGAWWDPRVEQYRCRRVGCLTTGTIHAADGMTPRTDPSAWADDPATILLITGHGIDVVELPLGTTPPEAIFSRAILPGPVALWASVRPRLLLFAATTGGAAVPHRLPAGLPEGALLHSTGSYVPLPPSRVRTGDVVWMRPPQLLNWRLPELGEVVDLLARRMGSDAAAQAGTDAGTADAGTAVAASAPADPAPAPSAPQAGPHRRAPARAAAARKA